MKEVGIGTGHSQSSSLRATAADPHASGRPPGGEGRRGRRVDAGAGARERRGGASPRRERRLAALPRDLRARGWRCARSGFCGRSGWKRSRYRAPRGPAVAPGGTTAEAVHAAAIGQSISNLSYLEVSVALIPTPESAFFLSQNCLKYSFKVVCEVSILY